MTNNIDLTEIEETNIQIDDDYGYSSEDAIYKLETEINKVKRQQNKIIRYLKEHEEK